MPSEEPINHILDGRGTAHCDRQAWERQLRGEGVTLFEPGQPVVWKRRDTTTAPIRTGLLLGRMVAPNQKAPREINRQQLATVGLVLVTRDPLVVQCMICGVEWRPARLPRVRWWKCHNSCHQSNEP